MTYNTENFVAVNCRLQLVAAHPLPPPPPVTPEHYKSMAVSDFCPTCVIYLFNVRPRDTLQFATIFFVLSFLDCLTICFFTFSFLCFYSSLRIFVVLFCEGLSIFLVWLIFLLFLNIFTLSFVKDHIFYYFGLFCFCCLSHFFSL